MCVCVCMFHTLKNTHTSTSSDVITPAHDYIGLHYSTLDSATTAPVKRRQRRCVRKQKRGKHGGVRARLAASPTRPAIPSIILAKVPSLDYKMDSICLLRSADRTVCNCCVLVFTQHGLMTTSLTPLSNLSVLSRGQSPR